MCVALVSVCADVVSVRVCVSVPRGCVFVIVCVYMCMMHVYAPPPLPPGGWGRGGRVWLCRGSSLAAHRVSGCGFGCEYFIRIRFINIQYESENEVTAHLLTAFIFIYA